MIVNGASSSAKLVFSRLHGDTPTLEQLVGRMDHNMFAAMEAEHTRAIDSDRQLFTHLGDSTSRIEWRFVMTPDDPPDGGWPLRDVEILQPDGSKLRTRRQPKPLSDFDEVVRGQNDALTAMGRYAVTREEIIMCRLYTSPMFMKYNGVLRNVRGPVAAAALAKLCELCGPPEGATTLEEALRGGLNLYPTSLHLLSSGLVKLSELTHAGKVYRGFRGFGLPDAMVMKDEFGCIGGVEVATFSTTMSLEVATTYAGRTEDPGAQDSVLFEIRMGLHSRGADLQFISEYPEEREITFPPLTTIEVVGMSTLQGQPLLQVELMPCTKTTIEDTLGRALKLLHSFLDAKRLDLRTQLAAAQVDEAQALFTAQLDTTGVLKKPPIWYMDDANFDDAYKELEKVKQSVLARYVYFVHGGVRLRDKLLAFASTETGELAKYIDRVYFISGQPKDAALGVLPRLKCDEREVWRGMGEGVERIKREVMETGHLFTEGDVGKHVSISGDELTMVDTAGQRERPRYALWREADHHDCSGVIVRIEEKYCGVVELEGGETFQNPYNHAVECLEYVLDGKAGSNPRKWWHAGHRVMDVFDDEARADGRAGQPLRYFVEHPDAREAGLFEEHVVALRLYTSYAYTFMVEPLRRGAPHPWPVTIAFLSDGIKRLRAVGSVRAGANEPRDLWRGTRNIEMPKDFLAKGGTEYAPMSTSAELQAALTYSNLAEERLLIKITTKGFMDRGAELSFLSLFPGEAECLFPPMTYLRPTGRSEVINVPDAGGSEADAGGGPQRCKFTVIEVAPQL